MEQKKKSALTRQKILSAAEYEFAEKRPAAARVDEIAARAGVNKQLLYVHFTNKECLYTAVLDNAYRRLEICEDALGKISFTDPDSIREIILSYFNFLSENPSFVRLLL